MSIGAAGPRIASERSAPPRAPTAPPKILARLLDLGERALIVLLFILFLAANLASPKPINVLLAATELVTVLMVLLRRPADSISLSPFDWSVAILGTTMPMFARPGGSPVAGIAQITPMILWAIGLALSVAAKLSLNRRFGVAPANRGVQARGAYAFIRHPMYAGYLLMNTAYFLVNPTFWNVAVYGLAWSCQFWRVRGEERWLSQDAAYRAYAKAVPFRVVPFVI